VHCCIRDQRNPDRNDSRSYGREQRTGLARCQDDRGVGRRFLQQLEKRIRRHVCTFLRHHPLCIANDEDFPLPNRWRHHCASNEVPNRRYVNPLASRRRCIEAHVLRSLGNGVRVVVADLILIGIAVLEARSREHPMEVGVSYRANVATRRARPARGVGLSAKKALRQPESEPLFSDAAGSLEQETRGKGSSPNAARQSRAQRLVSVQVDDWHVEIWSLQPHGSRDG